MSDQDQIELFIARSRQLNGKVVGERAPWNRVATADAIRHFALGIADDNPLWLDPAYAEKTRFGGLVAPPAFLTSVLYPVLHGAPVEVPLASLIAELEYEWYRPVLLGDELTGSARQLDAIDTEIEGRRGVCILAETIYCNGRGEVVARAKSTLVRLAVEEGRPLIEREISRYGEKELKEIGAAQLAEQRTGAVLLSSDEVREGAELPGLVRGPLTVGDMICWQAGIGPSYRPGSLGYQDAVAAPHSSVVNPVTGWPVKHSQQHEDFLLSSQRGMPAPFDNGVMRFAWMTPLLTNWMGDNGELRRLSVKVAAPNLYGDTTWYGGRIHKVTEEAHGRLASVLITGTNQLGEVTTTGRAEVWLPNEGKLHQPSRGQRQEKTLTSFWLALFADSVRRQPQAVAIEDDEQRLTYQALDDLSTRWARLFRASGAGPGRYVALCLDRGVGMVVAIIAVLKSGSAYVPIDPTYPNESTRFMLEDAAPALVVVDESTADVVCESAAPLINLSHESEAAADVAEQAELPSVAPGYAAYVMFTSGTTKLPKGTIVPHSSLVAYVESLMQALPVTANDVYLHTASFSFSASVRQWALPLAVGAKLHVAKDLDRWDPVSLFRLMQDHAITVWDTVPSIWRSCIDALESLKESRRSSLMENRLRLIMTTGEALPWSVPRAWRSRFGYAGEIVNLYSQTETTGTVCTFSVPQDDLPDHGVVPLGLPLGGQSVYLMEETFYPVVEGEIGEICVGGDQLASGYLNNPELTRDRFVVNPLDQGASVRLFRTHDLALRRADGCLEHRGRLDDIVNVRGVRVEPAEVQAALEQHPDVMKAAVLARQKDGLETHLVAYVVPRARAQTELPAEKLRNFLRERLPAHAIPSAFVAITEIPLTPNGKVDRGRLAVLESVSFSEAPTSPTLAAKQEDPRQILTRILLEVLEIEEIDPQGDFFEMGGDSLRAVALAIAIRRQLHIELPLRELYGGAASLNRLTSVLEDLRRQSEAFPEAGLSVEDEASVGEQPDLPVLPRPSRLISAGDIVTALTLVGLSPVAWLLPRRAWPPITRVASWIHVKSRGSKARQVAAALPELDVPTTGEALDRAQLAAMYEEMLFTLRDYVSTGWQSAIRIQGEETLRLVLAEGRGAVLWTYFCFYGGLMSKIALRRAGLPVVNIRDATHPYSTTLFGRYVLNPVRTRIEDRYLLGSIPVVEREKALALSELERVLDQKKPVAVAAHGSGDSPFGQPFLGGTLKLALGAPTLAAAKGAPLLPVFTVPNADGGFDVTIEPPLTERRDGSLREKAEDFARSYAAVLERYVRRYPAVWRGWFAAVGWEPPETRSQPVDQREAAEA